MSLCKFIAVIPIILCEVWCSGALSQEAAGDASAVGKLLEEAAARRNLNYTVHGSALDLAEECVQHQRVGNHFVLA